MQLQLFDETDDGFFAPNDFKPGLTIDERIEKYNTHLKGDVGYCECDHRRYHPCDDCIHIKELRLRNLQKIDETILQHISDKRDERDKDNSGLDGAIEKITNSRPDDFKDLLEITIRIARQKGSVCSDDLHVVTNEAYREDKIVGTVFAVLLKSGVLEEIGRKPTERKIAHGRKINVYKLTEKEINKYKGVSS